MCVFALNDPSSLQAIPRLHAQLRRALDSSHPRPCLLIGNKSDLPGCIEKSQIEAVLRELGEGCGYVETSAKKDENVREAFERLVRMIEQARQFQKGRVPLERKKKKKKCKMCTIN